MIKSVSLQRILLLTISTIGLFALVTLSLFHLLAPTVFVEAKMEELLPRAQFLASQTELYFKAQDTSEGLLGNDMLQWDAYVYIYGPEHELIVSSQDDATSALYYPARIANFEQLLDDVYQGETVSLVREVEVPQLDGKKSKEDHLILALPVRALDVEEEVVLGGVVMVKSIKEINAAIVSLTSTLSIAAVAVTLCIIPFVYMFSTRISRPIWRVRDIAINMMKGNLSVRARIIGKGEVADLGRAVNQMAEQMERNIRALDRERKQAMVIVEALAEGVLAMDGKLNVTQTNPALRKMMQHAEESGVDTTEMKQTIEEGFRVAIKEGRFVERRLPLGEMQLYVTITPTPASDDEIGSTHAIGVFHDETQSQRLEQTRRDYVANVSHELKTPLTALRAMIEPLQDGLIKTEEERQRTYAIILRETMRLSRLVDDMLELSRLQRGRLALEKTYVPVLPLLQELSAFYTAETEKTGQTYSLTLPQAPLPYVYGNLDRTEQVLRILLNNACTYTPPGSHIELCVEQYPDHLLVIVQDDGPGISKEDVQHVFERFYKADKSHSGSTGTGLGLAIAKELLEKLGEDITAGNRAEGGARFCFTLHFHQEKGLYEGAES